MSGQKHILIVDDDRALRSTLAVALETDGAFEVTQADSAAEAIAKTQARGLRCPTPTAATSAPACAAAGCGCRSSSSPATRPRSRWCAA
jgi:CheY-like chemotaxis protein